MRTKLRLAAVLREAGLLDMAVWAEGGYYDDFETPLATPILQLVTDLTDRGRPDLAERAKSGEWDCTREEARAWVNRARISGFSIEEKH
jgi:hypothetical protein